MSMPVDRNVPNIGYNKIPKVTHNKDWKIYSLEPINCNENHYLFQIRETNQFCTETRLPYELLLWLPGPLIDESG